MKTIITVVLFFSAVAYIEGRVCRDTNIWCPQMTKYGACGYYKPTQDQCPRACAQCKAQCNNVTDDARRECGHVGILHRECELRGCCFKTHTVKKVPWCFYPNEQCKFVEGHKRRDCGHYGITKNQCMDKGCCWSPVKGKYKNKHPWCHHSEDFSGSGQGSN